MPEKGQRPAQKLLRRTEAATLSRHTWPIVGFGLLTLLLFGAVLFRWDTRVLGNQTTDLYAQFIAWRDFGSRQLRAGNLALWNPHIYAGAPYFGGFQAALLYPLNVLFLIMPVAPAVNWTIALHVWLLGVLTYGWLIVRRLHPGACFVGGALAVLEMGVFAARALDTFDSTTVGASAVRTVLASRPGEYRILSPLNINSAMVVGASDLWGGDPGVVRRYAEFMTWT
jgi:hypothetical protein